MQGAYAYIGEGEKLTILDISTPTSPTVAGQTALPVPALSVSLSGNYAYTTIAYDDFCIVDVSYPTNPTVVGCYDTPGDTPWGKTSWDVFVSDDIAYVAAGAGGLRVLDVGDPTNPIELDYYYEDWWYPARGVCVSDNMAYLVGRDIDHDGGPFPWPYPWWGILWILDVSDPANLVRVARYRIENYTNDVYVSGNTAYVALSYNGPGDGGLLILDVTNLSSPIQLGLYATPKVDVEAVQGSGNIAYIAAGDAGLRVLDMSDPAHPVEVGFYDSPGYAQGVFVSNRLIYIADGSGGLPILRYTLMPVEECYCCSSGDSIYRVDASAFSGYATTSADDSSLIRVTSPPAPLGWNQPDFMPDSSWQPGSEVWWDEWATPNWSPLPADCRPIGLPDENGNPEAWDGTTHLYRRTFRLSPPHVGMQMTQAVLEMWSDNKTEWWWQGTSISYDREGYPGPLDLLPSHISPNGGTYVLAIQNSNDYVCSPNCNPQGTACRLCVTWSFTGAPRYCVYLPLMKK